jgi:hypothetical protein
LHFQRTGRERAHLLTGLRAYHGGRYPLLLNTASIRQHAAMVAKQYQGKFCWSTDFSPKFLAALINEGYLPMVRPFLPDKSQLSGVGIPNQLGLLAMVRCCRCRTIAPVCQCNGASARQSLRLTCDDVAPGGIDYARACAVYLAAEDAPAAMHPPLPRLARAALGAEARRPIRHLVRHVL